MKKQYDVVLMNPPFGENSIKTNEFIEKNYPDGQKNLICSFIIFSLNKLIIGGKIGSVIDRGILLRNSHENFRRKYLIHNGALFGQTDLGWNVLDGAYVEVSTILLDKLVENENEKLAFGIDVSVFEEKNDALFNSLKKANWLNISAFEDVPFCAINFQFPLFLLSALKKNKKIENSIGIFYNGHTIKKDVFTRLVWEMGLDSDEKKWIRMWNGSNYSPFYVPMQEIVIWGSESNGVSTHSSTVIRNPNKHYLPGLCFGSRGEYLDVQILPRSLILTNEGFGGPFKDNNETWYLLGYLNSKPIQYALNFYCGQHKGTGYVNSLPVPIESKNIISDVSEKTQEIWNRIRNAHCFIETDPHFISIFPENMDKQDNLKNLIQFFIQESKIITSEARKIDDIMIHLLNISDVEKDKMTSCTKNRPETALFNWTKKKIDSQDAEVFFYDSIISYAIGCIFGRWDIRYTTQSLRRPVLQRPFDSLPDHPPGMLLNEKGFPASQNRIVSEEWINERKSCLDLPKTTIHSIISDKEYPIEIVWNGILVNDPGDPNDITTKVKNLINIIWGNKSQDFEKNFCDSLDTKSLDEYIKKKFFEAHVKRYSNSKRSAPIYWKLSSNKGNYSLWIYYHRLSRDTLYVVLRDYIDPKIDLEDGKYQELKRKKESETDSFSRSQLTKIGKEIESKADFINELKDFKEKLEKIAKRGYDPDFDDGVILNMAPLHEVISWKEPKAYWDDLEKGKYDWAHIAMKYWPDRIKEKCKKDKSIAIAHGLEHLYEAN